MGAPVEADKPQRVIEPDCPGVLCIPCPPAGGNSRWGRDHIPDKDDVIPTSESEEESSPRMGSEILRFAQCDILPLF